MSRHAAAVSFGSSFVRFVILIPQSREKDLSKGEWSHPSSLRARRFDCEVPHCVRDDTVGRVRAIRYTAAVSFGSSIVPLNFGGSSSIPKLSE
jgi:hypothetical protein